MKMTPVLKTGFVIIILDCDGLSFQVNVHQSYNYCIKSNNMAKNRLRIKFMKRYFLHVPKFVKTCMLFFHHWYNAGSYSSDVFHIPSAFLRQGKSCQDSWFSTRTWLHHNETYKISSVSRAKIVPKLIKIVSTDVRNYKIFSGEIPQTPLTRGGCPLSCSPPTRAFGTRKKSLIFQGRTTFQKPTTALT